MASLGDGVSGFAGAAVAAASPSNNLRATLLLLSLLPAGCGAGVCRCIGPADSGLPPPPFQKSGTASSNFGPFGADGV